MKEAPLRFTIFSFLAHTHFKWECLGQISHSIKITVFKTLRTLDTIFYNNNFACIITRVSPHEHKDSEHCLCTQSLPKREFLDNSHFSFSIVSYMRPLFQLQLSSLLYCILICFQLMEAGST